MLISNIDSIFFSIDVSNYDSNNLELLQKLEESKKESKFDSEKDTIVTLGLKQFKILPNGARFHAYILHNETIELKFSQNRSKNATNFPISVRIKSTFLWEKGFIDAYLEVVEFLKSIIQGDFIAEKLSRADLCCHVDNLNFKNSSDIYDSWRGVFRKVQYFTFNRKVTGLCFGSFKEKNVMCRIYDKSEEIKTSQKTWFNDIWEKEGMDINNVWNVEFQVGRKFFKAYNVETVQDFILKMRAIWEQLTTNWIVYINLDDERITRCSTRDCWKEIQDAYLDYCYQQIIKRENQINTKAEELMPLLVGVLTSYGACKQSIKLEDILRNFEFDMKNYLITKKNNVALEEIVIDKLEYISS